MAEMVPIHARIPAELRDAVDQLAAKLDRKASWIMRKALERYVEQHRENKRPSDD